MKLAVSNIAWLPGQDYRVAAVLRDVGVDAIEVAPTKLWPDPSAVDVVAAHQERLRWRELGLDVMSTQSLLYGRPELQLLAAAPARERLIEYLQHVVTLGAALGAAVQVFGSPKNRLRGSLTASEAMVIAVDVFSRIASVAEEVGTAIVIEANPEYYGADFLTSVHEAAELVETVGRQGVRLHLDTACMLLAGDDPARCVQRYAPLLAHVHLSEPDLRPVGVSPSPAHAEIICALKGVGYEGGISVEMRPAEDAIDGVKVAAEYARRLLDAT